MFRSESYRNLIGEVKDGNDLKNHIAPISLDEIRVVDERLAMLLGEKIIGSQPSLGSQTEIGDFTIQKVNNKLYWVAPLLHTGFLKWFNNSEGTPGYVMVSATNERDVKLVQEINGKPIKIKYQPEAFFGSEIERHVYFNGYTTTGLADFNFEIDDAGVPFWIVTTYKKEVGFGGSNATGSLVVNAQTGEIQHYEIGIKPMRPKNIKAEYENDTLTVKITVNGETLTLTSNIILPEGKGPFPAVIGIGRGSGSLPPDLFSTRNIVQIPFNFAQVMAWQQKRGSEPINKLYPELVHMGAYSAWSWGVSRLIDGLELVAEKLPVDLNYIGITGCSFAGKMALYAGAFDERIALTIAQESGGGGAAAWRVSETLGNV